MSEDEKYIISKLEELSNMCGEFIEKVNNIIESQEENDCELVVTHQRFFGEKVRNLINIIKKTRGKGE